VKHHIIAFSVLLVFCVIGFWLHRTSGGDSLFLFIYTGIAGPVLMAVCQVMDLQRTKKSGKAHAGDDTGHGHVRPWK
jgi:sugar phosphate permease